MLFIRHHLVCALLLRRGFPLATLGEKSTGCSWTFCPDGLGPESIVYSGGVGRDISFERSLWQEFGCSVYMFDPSPTGIETMGLPENRIQQFRFFPLALAGYCGTLRLAAPLSDEGSWYSSGGVGEAIDVPCKDLPTVMKENRQRKVDLLKLDIEGAEYGVLNQLTHLRLPVTQILVEFHDGILPGFRLSQSLGVTARLLIQGYKLVARVGNNHTFLHPGKGSAVG
jgi:FkbM family methyltransferase